LTENIPSVSDDEFEETVLSSPLPVIVDFWAVWCGPCQMMNPTMEHLAENYKEKMKVVKMNVDENMKTPSRYGIMSIPTLLFFKGGELLETMIGVQPQDKVMEAILKHL